MATLRSLIILLDEISYDTLDLDGSAVRTGERLGCFAEICSAMNFRMVGHCAPLQFFSELLDFCLRKIVTELRAVRGPAALLLLSCAFPWP